MDDRWIVKFLLLLFCILHLGNVPYCDAAEKSRKTLSKKPKICTAPAPTTTLPPVCLPIEENVDANQKTLPNQEAVAQETGVTSSTTPVESSTKDSATTEASFEQFGDTHDRIVGGTPVSIIEVPYQASLQKSGSHICGAGIISSIYLTTAAHCNLANATAMRVRVGSSLRTSGGQLLPVAEMISHPKYVEGRADYDFCIVKLKFEMVFTPFCQPIKMIEPNEELFPDSYISVQGWGLTDENGPVSLPLLQITVPLISTADCKNVYGNKTITKRMFCAGDLTGKKDSCQGDSGGPAVCEGILVGIVSWGYGCARAGYPGVYSKIANQREWINNVTGI